MIDTKYQWYEIDITLTDLPAFRERLNNLKYCFMVKDKDSNGKYISSYRTIYKLKGDVLSTITIQDALKIYDVLTTMILDDTLDGR